MIYFIINNNYQYYDFELHLFEIQAHDIALIEIPHALDAHEHHGVSLVLQYRAASRNGFVSQILNYLRQSRRIGHEIFPTKNDVCFLYTEYELLNQYIVMRFKKAGARVFLIEDGGLATYLPFRILDSELLTAREWVKQQIFRMLPGLSGLRLHKINGHILSWMPDSFLDGVCFYRPLAIARNIPTILLRRQPQPRIEGIQGRVVFLNEPMYIAYQNEEEYLIGLNQIIKSLCGDFDTVLFKFHPRETIEWRSRIRQRVLSNFPGVKIIEDNAGIEEVIDQYYPSVAASYFSAGLLNLLDRGVEPLYLYHLIPDLNQQPICREATSVLHELGYTFVHNFSDVSANYQSGLLGTSKAVGAVSLAELICEY